MIYRAIGLMSGSSLDGLDIAFAEFTEIGGRWSYEIIHADCIPYSTEWAEQLANAVQLSALDYQLLHTAYGHYTGQQVNAFIERYQLQHKVQLLVSHGHTTFHQPAQKMTAQLGDGAAIAASTGLNVVSDLRAMDVALGGQGAPIVPLGEQLLWKEYNYFLNIGGIANISIHDNGGCIAYDVCAANRVLNLLAAEMGAAFDDGGQLAATGTNDESLLYGLNHLSYYGDAYPKSLANSFGTDVVFPMIQAAHCSTADALRTYTEHIATQVAACLQAAQPGKLLITGGGAFNHFLVQRIAALLQAQNIDVVVPNEQTVQYKEALIMALLGILRWREEATVLTTVTGATRASVGGALWLGQD